VLYGEKKLGLAETFVRMRRIVSFGWLRVDIPELVQFERSGQSGLW